MCGKSHRTKNDKLQAFQVKFKITLHKCVFRLSKYNRLLYDREHKAPHPEQHYYSKSSKLYGFQKTMFR